MPEAIVLSGLLHDHLGSNIVNEYRGGCTTIERTQLLHCFPNFVPGWRTAERDIPDMVALACPKPLHLNFGAAQPPSSNLSPLCC